MGRGSPVFEASYSIFLFDMLQPHLDSTPRAVDVEIAGFEPIIENRSWPPARVHVTDLETRFNLLCSWNVPCRAVNIQRSIENTAKGTGGGMMRQGGSTHL